MNSNITVICVYNNEDVFNNTLKASLEKQDIGYELVALDNRGGQFTSAAAALNCGAQSHTGDGIFIFVHQDIEFVSNDSLRKFAESIEKFRTGDIVGVAGAKSAVRKIYTNITYGNEYKKYTEPPYNTYGLEKDFVSVDTVDECLFGMKKETYEMYKFNEQVCDGWHFYAAEICMNAVLHQNNVYVVKSDVNHLGGKAVTDKGFRQVLQKLANHYAVSFRTIATTCIFTTIELRVK